jgi:hypothetical protein
MKKFLMLLCAVTLIFGVVGTASALSFTNTKIFKIGVEFSDDHKEQTWTFNLDAQTAIDPEDTVKKAKIKILFGGLKPGEADIEKDMTALVADHKIYVTVKQLEGKFRVKSMILWAKYKDNHSYAPVPEPATILFMGVGLLGLVGYSRKRFSKKS